ncbi:hypothetical protein LCGC14_1369440 [marine sediment metagenome]|uniref:Uncharacterized protein n=1 Tax=marine sediment metagenome TaxID=412755 RepID=A0A0F9ML02_9ZZZZ
MRLKYGSVRTYSTLCQREFASKKEAIRAEELTLLEKDGQIIDLEFQILFGLCEKPKITITIDFSYWQDGKVTYEDSKGVLTRDTRTKLAWLHEKYGTEVILS